MSTPAGGGSAAHLIPPLLHTIYDPMPQMIAAERPGCPLSASGPCRAWSARLASGQPHVACSAAPTSWAGPCLSSTVPKHGWAARRSITDQLDCCHLIDCSSRRHLPHPSPHPHLVCRRPNCAAGIVSGQSREPRQTNSAWRSHSAAPWPLPCHCRGCLGPQPSPPGAQQPRAACSHTQRPSTGPPGPPGSPPSSSRLPGSGAVCACGLLRQPPPRPPARSRGCRRQRGV